MRGKKKVFSRFHQPETCRPKIRLALRTAQIDKGLALLDNSNVDPSPKPAALPASGSKSNRGPGRPTLSNAALLDKALDIFLEKGFERTSIDAITAAAGVAKRTVYLRYGDKAALFKAALERAIDEWILPVEALQAVECEDLEETLMRVGQILVANIMTPAGLRLLRISNAESGRMPEIGAYTFEHGTGRTITYLADLFRRRIRPGGRQLADADDAALAFLYLVVCGPSTMTAWGMTLDDATIDLHTRYCVHLFLHGLLPRETNPRRSASEDQAVLASAPVLTESTARAPELKALEIENRRLKKLLVESMLELATFKEKQATD